MPSKIQALKEEREPGKVLTPYQHVRTLFERHKLQISKALPRQFQKDAPRIFQTLLSAVAKNERLQECSDESLLGAAIQAITLGLDFNPELQQAWLIPRRKKIAGQYVWQANFQLGVGGNVELMMRSGKLASADALAVYERDEWDYAMGTSPYVHHKQYIGADRPGDLLCSWACAHPYRGKPWIRIVPLWEILQAKSFSRDSDGIWSKHFGPMARNTAIKRIRRMVPSSPDLIVGMTLDAQAEQDVQDLSMVLEEGPMVIDNPQVALEGERVMDESADEERVSAEESKRLAALNAIAAALKHASTTDDVDALLDKSRAIASDDEQDRMVKLAIKATERLEAQDPDTDKS